MMPMRTSLSHANSPTSAGSLRRDARLPRCADAPHDLRLGKASPHPLVGQAIRDAVAQSTRSGCQFVGTVEFDQRIERE
ncbi:MAG: hypothetical protein DMF77_15400 [Acidobacteria bacterium]|nr:MAG: hypothetical protein DMF77_15400 [Acidobacteriota bacterium]